MTARDHNPDAARHDGLDRIFHEPARLSILTVLASRRDGVLFNDLKEWCGLTDGNLSRHIQALSAASVVEVWKNQSSGRPRTLIVLTREGRVRFIQYLDTLEGIVHSALEASRRPGARAPGGETRVRPTPRRRRENGGGFVPA